MHGFRIAVVVVVIDCAHTRNHQSEMADIFIGYQPESERRPVATTTATHWFTQFAHQADLAIAKQAWEIYNDLQRVLDDPNTSLSQAIKGAYSSGEFVLSTRDAWEKYLQREPPSGKLLSALFTVREESIKRRKAAGKTSPFSITLLEDRKEADTEKQCGLITIIKWHVTTSEKIVSAAEPEATGWTL